MLKNRLRVLLAERQLKIKNVIENTELSRNTVSRILNNEQANIATRIIDELCQYLNITPAEFFVYRCNGHSKN